MLDVEIEPRQAALISPRIYVVRMGVFLILVAFAAAILYPQIERAFLANPLLNGLIVAALFLGIAYGFMIVFRLFREVHWVNNFRIGEPARTMARNPVLLAPMAALLRDRQSQMSLTPMSMRSLLDSLATRLDESRDILRYLTGLLIFLGLLGTFWGLLETVSSVGTTIRALDVTQTESGVLFEELKTGLEAPLSGMGTAFSSSLFGLAGSLVLGFLDLQASQAQNRFYTDLEDWLSTITDIGSGEGHPYAVPHYLRLDLRDMQETLGRIDTTLQETLNAAPEGGSETEAIELLADAVHGLVRQMREEQRIVREWAQAQADQQTDIKQVLERLVEQSAADTASVEPARVRKEG